MSEQNLRSPHSVLTTSGDHSEEAGTKRPSATASTNPAHRLAAGAKAPPNARASKARIGSVLDFGAVAVLSKYGYGAGDLDLRSEKSRASHLAEARQADENHPEIIRVSRSGCIFLHVVDGSLPCPPPLEHEERIVSDILDVAWGLDSSLLCAFGKSDAGLAADGGREIAEERMMTSLRLLEEAICPVDEDDRKTSISLPGRLVSKTTLESSFSLSDRRGKANFRISAAVLMRIGIALMLDLPRISAAFQMTRKLINGKTIVAYYLEVDDGLPARDLRDRTNQNDSDDQENADSMSRLGSLEVSEEELGRPLCSLNSDMRPHMFRAVVRLSAEVSALEEKISLQDGLFVN